MNSPAWAASAAATISSSVAPGLPKATLSRTVPEKRRVSCRTIPIWDLSEDSVTSRTSLPSTLTAPPVVEARYEVDERGLPRARSPQNGHGLPWPGGKGHAGQDIARAARVAERDVVEVDPAGEGKEDGGIGGVLYVEGASRTSKTLWDEAPAREMLAERKPIVRIGKSIKPSRVLKATRSPTESLPP